MTLVLLNTDHHLYQIIITDHYLLKKLIRLVSTTRRNGAGLNSLFFFFSDITAYFLHALQWSSHAAKHTRGQFYLNFKNACKKSVCHLLITIKEKRST